MRTILGIDEQRRSLTFAGDMPQGGIARLMRANNDQLIDSAGKAVAQATHGFDAEEAPLVISVSCVGRRLVLGERTEEEVETVVDGAPCRVPATWASIPTARSRRRWPAASANCTTRR